MKTSMGVVFGVVVASAALCCVGASSDNYYGWTTNGCPATPPSDPSQFNALQSGKAAQWWTVTLIDDTHNIGGMINYVRLLAVSTLQVTLTDGVSSPPTLAADQGIHLFHDIQPGSFCIGSSTDGGCFYEDIEQRSIHINGTTAHASYDLIVRQAENETWCMMSDATKAIGISWPQEVSWWHYAPRAIVEGSVTINGKTYTVQGTGQQDHVFGTFIPFVTLFKHWVDAHFYSSSRTDPWDLYWGSMAGRFSFVRIETTLGSHTFSESEVTSSRSYPNATSTRPSSYQVAAKAATGETFEFKYQPLVPGLDFGSSPVEDLVGGLGSFCNAAGACQKLVGRGWAQVIGGQGN